MSLDLPPLDEAGGLLEMEYANPSAGVRHSFRMHVCRYDALTGNYLGAGLKVPTEHDLPETFSALGAIWAAFYPASWTLRVVSLIYNSGGERVRLPVIPTFPPITGATGADAYLGPCVRRIYRVRSLLGGKRRVWIQQVEGVELDGVLPVSPTGGGVDARDQALMAYLASLATGCVAPDGWTFRPDASMRIWGAPPLEEVPPPSGPGPFLVSG